MKCVTDTVESGALGRGRARARARAHSRGPHAACGGPAHRLDQLPAPGRGAPLPAAAAGRAGLRARERARPHGARRRAAPARHRHDRQGLPRRASGARRARHRRRARRGARASASTRSRWCGRSSRGARGASRRASRSCWSSRRSARCSRSSSRACSTTSPRARACSASAISTARRWCPPRASCAPGQVVAVLRRWLERCAPELAAACARRRRRPRRLAAPALVRLPAFCSGCPHNRSTVVPEGSVAQGGIGCHGMAVWLPERRTLAVTQMGGEGANWIGAAPFTDTPHIFQNLGDGTYFHSGPARDPRRRRRRRHAHLQDPRQRRGGDDRRPADRGRVDRGRDHGAGDRAAAARRGRRAHRRRRRRAGQVPGDGALPGRRHLPPPRRDRRACSASCARCRASRRCSTTRPARPRRAGCASAASSRIPTSASSSTSASARAAATAACRATASRSSRSRRTGAASAASTRARATRTRSCLLGHCPSFVSVHGGRLRRARERRRRRRRRCPSASCPPPATPDLDAPWNVLITGIGGSGVVTVGALLGMAAHLEGKGASVLDVTGLAQKNGPVTSHVRVAARPDQLHATRIAAGAADLVIGCDIVVAASPENLAKLAPGRSAALINSHVAPTFEFASNPDLDLSGEPLRAALRAARRRRRLPLRRGHAARDGAARRRDLHQPVPARATRSRWAACPSRLAALERAIELNGRAVEANKRALAWGRLAALDLAAVERAARRADARSAPPEADTLDALVERRAAFLTDYQDAAYAARYRALVDARRRARARRHGRAAPARARGRTPLREAARREGRVRGRAPLHRRRVPQAARVASSRATTGSCSTWRRRTCR